MIVVDNAVKVYRRGASEVRALNGVSLTVPKGQFLSVMGSSGSGKSTMLNLLGALDVPTSGSIRIDGKEISRLPDDDLSRFRRDHLGFIFQFFNLLPTLTIEENLLLPLELCGTLDAAGRRRALDLLDAVGLADLRAKFPDRLSGGEQQRAAVARALVHDPELVLADEPTGNLDDHNAHAVLDLFTRLLRPSGKTLLMVTHSAEAETIGDRVLELHDGRLGPRARSARA
jgi:putative ABC transport system ATP-binding protein